MMGVSESIMVNAMYVITKRKSNQAGSCIALFASIVTRIKGRYASDDRIFFSPPYRILKGNQKGRTIIATPRPPDRTEPNT